MILPSLAIAGAVAIVIVYLLRRKPRERTVSSILLWQDVLQETLARRPWQRLRRRLPFWLELTAALLLAVALARSWLPPGSTGTSGVVLVLDASASMAAGDRWQAGIAAAEEILLNTSGSSRGAVVLAGVAAELLIHPDLDPGLARQVLQQLRREGPSVGGADWSGALALAEAAIAGLPQGSVVHIVTDGSDPGLQTALTGKEADRAAPAYITTVGEPVDNVALLAGFMSANDGGTGEITVTVANFGRRPVQSQVLLDSSGLPAAVQPVTLQAGEVVNVVFPGIKLQDQYRAALIPRDEYPLDDELIIQPAATFQPRIALLARRDVALIVRALQLYPGTSVIRVEPDDLPALLDSDAPGQRVHLLVVVDEPLPQLPEGLAASLPVLWINPPAGAGTMNPAVAFTPERLVLGAAPELAPLLQNIDPSRFRLLEARELPVQPGDIPLLFADGRVIAIYRPPHGDRAGQVTLGWDPYKGDILLRPDWPILIYNVMTTLLQPFIAGGDGTEAALHSLAESVAVTTAPVVGGVYPATTSPPGQPGPAPTGSNMFFPRYDDRDGWWRFPVLLAITLLLLDMWVVRRAL